MPTVNETNPQASLTERIRVLAVDDHFENLVALEAAFDHSEFELITALSGREALAKADEMDFAAILLDVQMPIMDGFETARLLRQKRIVTPIIFLTAINHSDQYEKLGYVSGAVDFLFKPLDTDILRAKVGVFVELQKAKLQNAKQAELLKEQALIQQEYRLLRRAVEVRDEFMSIAAHELNTPMTPLSLQLQSFLKLLKEGRLHTIETSRLTRMLESASGQVERLSRIIQELVDVSRISVGKLEIVRKNTSLQEIVDDVLAAFSEEIRQVGCTVSLKIRANPAGHWDRIRIEQIVINLLSNALKYGLGRDIEITLDQSGDSAVLEVQDHGIGIAPSDHGRIFERFERAVSAENYGGLGLGLFITAKIVRLHGGRITVESEPNHGAKFRVELPLVPTETSGVSDNINKLPQDVHPQLTLDMRE